MGTSRQFESDLFNAFADVMFKYSEYALDEPDRKDDVKELMNRIIDRFYEGRENEQ